ncbi:mercuric reductase [Tengunoibacter tsumagoiensis]|uniref:Mercuric reductase n=1 Tax=Tengunoibacter tsumagoiensis TaxID=2014871 RepID=A0A402A0C6_9CHLR|nr:mercuric reductase [Tengunoibacter tsumagoiensis]GCE12564.1 mercuric reductase [Tengunoibacter tsumagoiensis]
MAKTTHYDVIIIGSGQAGGPLAGAFAGSGKKTALIEREHVGGTCINEGCTPTKTMVASARVAYLTRRAADYGVHSGPVTINMAEVRQRKRAIVESFRGGSERRLRSTEHLDLLMGEAQFTGPHAVEVHMNSGETLTLTAETICINTGDRPTLAPVEGIETVPTLNSTTIMELDTVPEHLIVLGGGYVGLEFGQMFRRFGSQVTIIQRGAQLLSQEDPDIAVEVQKILQEDGIEVLLKTSAVKVAKQGEQIQVTIRDAHGERIISGSHLLSAAGRQPNTDRLNITAAGVQLDKHGYIQVNDRLETNVAGIYALGDTKGGPAFTHISYDDFRILRTNLIEQGHASMKDRATVYTVFIDPQLGRIGLSEQEARRQGKKIKVAKMPMSYVARALEIDEARGVMKAIVDAESDLILGASILGIEGGEIMSMLEIAMLGKLPYTVLRDGVFAHPTLAESLNNLFGSFTS